MDMNQPPTTTADLMQYAVAAPAAAVAAPPAARSHSDAPVAARTHATRRAAALALLQQRVRELEAALASSEAERERLTQRVAALEAEKKHPKPRGRMPLGATGWDHATGTWQYPPGVLPQSPRKRARRASVKARRKWEGESSDEEPPPAVAAGAVFIDDGQCWLVYKREARSLPINADDVVYLLLPGQKPQADGADRPRGLRALERGRRGRGLDRGRLMKKRTRARAPSPQARR